MKKKTEVTAAVIVVFALLGILVWAALIHLLLFPFIFYIIGNLFFTAPFFAYQVAWITVVLLKAIWG